MKKEKRLTQKDLYPLFKAVMAYLFINNLHGNLYVLRGSFDLWSRAVFSAGIRMVFFGLRMDFIFIVLVDASFGKLYIYIYIYIVRTLKIGYVIEALSFLTLILRLESCCKVTNHGGD